MAKISTEALNRKASALKALQVYRWRLAGEKTAEIAKKLGLSESRVRQIIAKGKRLSHYHKDIP